MIPITEEALQRMEKRASDYSDGTRTDNPTAHQLVLHVRVLAGEVRHLKAEIARLNTTVATVLADCESEHPGGWGPDVTTVALLRQAVA